VSSTTPRKHQERSKLAYSRSFQRGCHCHILPRYLVLLESILSAHLVDHHKATDGCNWIAWCIAWLPRRERNGDGNYRTQAVNGAHKKLWSRELVNHLGLRHGQEFAGFHHADMGRRHAGSFPICLRCNMFARTVGTTHQATQMCNEAIWWDNFGVFIGEDWCFCSSHRTCFYSNVYWRRHLYRFPNDNCHACR
jgi:hypothetical protein